MKEIYMRSSLFLCLFMLATRSLSQAAVENVKDINGQLTGATGLIINGTSFDVAFVDENFESAFKNTIPLIHDTVNEAIAFGNLLNNNVFLDIVSGQFDTKPNLINGCGNSIVCFVRIPYQLEQGIGNIFNVNTVNVNNYSDELNDQVTFTSSFPTYRDFAAYSNNVYAVFSPSQVASIPEPSLYMMLLFGLLFIRACRYV